MTRFLAAYKFEGGRYLEYYAPMSLPEDPKTPGNAWCEVCQQSISKSRAAAHLVSARHASKSQKTSIDTSAPSAPPAIAPSIASSIASESGITDEIVERERPSKKTDKHHGLPADPEKPGYFWCGICQVSLSPSKAEGHIDTTRHQEASKKHISQAMKSRTKMSK